MNTVSTGCQAARLPVKLGTQSRQRNVCAYRPVPHTCHDTALHVEQLYMLNQGFGLIGADTWELQSSCTPAAERRAYASPAAAYDCALNPPAQALSPLYSDLQRQR